MAVKKKSALEIDLENADLMSILSNSKEGTSSLFTENQIIDYSYKTGITLLDYVTGYEVIVRDEHDEFVKKRVCMGIQAGSFNVITGMTQSFKTTITMQIIANIAFANNGNVVHYDAENRLVLQRVKTITKLPNDWFTGTTPRYKLKSGAIGYDTLQSDISELYENKMKYKQVLLKDTGEVDDTNKPIMLMPPTIVFVDSLQDMVQKEYEITDKKALNNLKELRSNMYGAQSAKTLRGLLTDIMPMLKEANIILIVIAHKTSNMSLNPFAGVKKQFQYGAADERMSGGSAVEFNASFVGSLSGLSANDTRFHVSSDGFEGNTVLLEPTKVSTNESGNLKTGLGFHIIVDKRKDGVDNIRTLIEFLNSRNRLKGNKAGFRVVDKKGEPITEKFTWKKVYENFSNDKEMLKTFMTVAKEELEPLIAKADENAKTIEVFDIDNMLNSLD